MTDYDLAVLGAGAAGLTAAMFAGRYGLRVAVVDRMGIGGQIINAEKVVNFPGFPQGLAGYDLGPLLQEQAEAAGAEFVIDEALSLQVAGEERLLRCAENELRSRAVIIAAGSSLRALGIPGEAELEGRGVSHCATCDGPFFAGREVCVVGGGDSAVDEAVVLAGHASKVLLVHRGDGLEAQQSLIDEALRLPNIELVPNTTVEEIIGGDGVTGARLLDATTGRPAVRELAGVFIYAGLEPNTRFLDGVVELDPTGHVVVDLLMRTSVEGVFAAGDIRTGSVAQLAASAGDGATAAIAAYRYVRGLERHRNGI